MTYLELLSWARKGLAAEKAKWREMQGKAIEGGAKTLVDTEGRVDSFRKRYAKFAK